MKIMKDGNKRTDNEEKQRKRRRKRGTVGKGGTQYRVEKRVVRGDGE